MMELIKENPALFRYIIVSIGLIIVYFISGYIIKVFKLKISRWQFSIVVFGLYLIIDFLSSWF